MSVAAVGALTVLLAASAAAEDRGLAECEAEARAAIDSVTAQWCLTNYGRTSGDRSGALEVVERLAAEFPESPGPPYARAKLLFLTRLDETMRSLDVAIERFARLDDPEGEAYARLYRAKLLSARMTLDEADAEIARVETLARRVDDRDLDAGIDLVQAGIARNRGQYAETWRILRGIELDGDFERLRGSTRVGTYQWLHIVASRLGFSELAGHYRRKMLTESRLHGDRSGEMGALSALAKEAERRVARGEISREEAVTLARESVELIGRAGNTSLEMETRLALARLLEGEEQREELRAVIAGSDSNPFCRPMLIQALMDMGTNLSRADPERLDEALAYLERAVALARSSGFDKTSSINAISRLVRAHLQYSPRERAIEEVARGLQLIENIVDRQSSERLAANMMAAYAGHYYALADRFLTEEPEPGVESIAGAFRAIETLRARVLRRYLAGVRGEATVDAELAAEHERVLGEITDRQIELTSSTLPDDRRRQLLAELERLELDADAVRFRLRRARGGSDPPPPVVTLREVREALEPRDALLSFSISPAAGESWLLAITRDEARAYPLPSRDELAEAVHLWLGLVARRDPTERFGAARLYGALLEKAVDDLPAGVTRLIVVPDGPLHHVPLEALRASSSDLPLVVRFEVAVVPSASVWRALRLRAAARRRPTGALVFAAPQLHPGSSAATRDGLSLASWQAPGALAFTRREGRSVLRALGGRGRLHLAEQATEARLKSEDLQRYGLLHFATHAFVDGDSPERSAILLAPGEAWEDGLIQPREVLEMRLDGTIVALSACTTAGGEVLPGEGVLSLGRSFLQAGSVAVVGGLWPLGDRETARLVDGFYERLARGAPVATALAEAKRARVRAGAPTAEWAGVVVIGAGYEAGWPLVESSPRVAGLRIAALAALLLLAAWLAFRRRSAS